jgi:hypothetical protein
LTNQLSAKDEEIHFIKAREEALQAEFSAKEAQHTAAMESRQAESPATFASKEAEYIAALEAKDRTLKQNEEEHAVCITDLSLKDEELQIIKERIVGFRDAVYVYQHANETANAARLDVERKLADAEKAKVWLRCASLIKYILICYLTQAEKDKQIKGKNTSITVKEKKVKELSLRLMEAGQRKSEAEKKLETINTFITSQTHVTAAGIAAIIASNTAASNSVGDEEPV